MIRSLVRTALYHTAINTAYNNTDYNTAIATAFTIAASTLMLGTAQASSIPSTPRSEIYSCDISISQLVKQADGSFLSEAVETLKEDIQIDLTPVQSEYEGVSGRTFCVGSLGYGKNFVFTQSPAQVQFSVKPVTKCETAGYPTYWNSMQLDLQYFEKSKTTEAVTHQTFDRLPNQFSTMVTTGSFQPIVSIDCTKK
ncbi:MAG: hypothetical protein EOP09_03640 [Proteobacteria bacterium]|nr:MAG: hypothetical protein EOP09_03640 [Pseudomonadota bacterium]